MDKKRIEIGSAQPDHRQASTHNQDQRKIVFFFFFSFFHSRVFTLFVHDVYSSLRLLLLFLLLLFLFFIRLLLLHVAAPPPPPPPLRRPFLLLLLLFLLRPSSPSFCPSSFPYFTTMKNFFFHFFQFPLPFLMDRMLAGIASAVLSAFFNSE